MDNNKNEKEPENQKHPPLSFTPLSSPTPAPLPAPESLNKDVVPPTTDDSKKKRVWSAATSALSREHGQEGRTKQGPRMKDKNPGENDDR